MDYLITYGIAILLLALCVWWNWDTMKLNSHSLHLQWLFWIAVIFPILSCIYFGSIVWYEYPLEVSKNGYNDFLEISKLPLYFLAGSPILGAFVASAHRSYQTDIQIKTANAQLIEAQKKNKIDVYFARRKFIIERLEKKEFRFFDRIDNANYIYDKVYFFNDYSDEIQDEFFSSIDGQISLIVDKVNVLDEFHRNITNETILNAHTILAQRRMIKLVANMLQLTGIPLKKNLSIQQRIVGFSEAYEEYVRELPTTSYQEQDCTDILKNLLGNYLDILKLELSTIEEFFREFFAVLLLDRNAREYLPSLSQLNFDDGDKLAAENQNPPE
ncbi:TPA: hypothetical protein U2M19_002554 [Providencia rettgeri]|uniref:hypothetical protein n=1 Tax=Providencia rettgeri TaxID=587 RepID=UPI0018C84C28|nr:hypothetical protein [Providencia rettgeri]MBG5921532.1 hypothetical protein [Providencia rettgeri]HEM8211690.1 hypothetical protein [Providencia rettgeri]